jgi:hypothetical protein
MAGGIAPYRWDVQFLTELAQPEARFGAGLQLLPLQLELK